MANYWSQIFPISRHGGQVFGEQWPLSTTQAAEAFSSTKISDKSLAVERLTLTVGVALPYSKPCGSNPLADRFLTFSAASSRIVTSEHLSSRPQTPPTIWATPSFSPLSL